MRISKLRVASFQLRVASCPLQVGQIWENGDNIALELLLVLCLLVTAKNN